MLAESRPHCPVEKLEIYKGGVFKIVRKSKLQGSYISPRGRIKKMSKKSLIRLIATMQATEINFGSMLTLTYPKTYPVDGSVVKEDLRVFLQWVRRRYPTEYLWFLEFQERGAPHLHVLLEISEITPRMRADVGLKWTELIALSDWFVDCFVVIGEGLHVRLDRLPIGNETELFMQYKEIKMRTIDQQGYTAEVSKIARFNTHPSVWELAKSPGGLKNYASKYASKMRQKTVPKEYLNIGRFWGCSRGVRAIPKQIVDTTELEVRAMLEAKGYTAAKYDHLPIWVFKTSTEG